MKFLIDTHLKRVEQHLDEEDKDNWQVIEGASDDAINKLLSIYPDCPITLLELLKRVDGTYWRKYGEVTVSFLLFGSDVGEDFGYYLLSCDGIIEENKCATSIADDYGEWLEQEDIIFVDKRIDINMPMDKRLCFAHCMNNGGTSILYIDFNPINDGKVGQVIRYLHDPDSYIVLANSFDEYLDKLTNTDYQFVPQYR
ncbi:SMI1/KNR4 family protein [Xenorhabdus budapestensis]|uniref:SMI1/KNR4 family protein n=1 Tax=Xenorhabdus budapestensis TaxID=290110 RepID=A0ABX7VGM8_XENBU|nr:SMI1/KNR4 family protein [Xenorhabdus budapestensis]QTL39076.1 SMI1/KNR4 family protein [Xenorhabdus budapestensis]